MTVWMDGGLATQLQGRGLPPYTPVDGWLLAHPAEVIAAHRAFIEAGAEVILAGTFSLHPAIRADALALLPVAVGLAAAAAPARLFTCHGSPRRAGEAPWRALSERRRAEILSGWEQVAALLRSMPAVDGVVLETFVDVEELEAAVRTVRAAGVAGLLVASLNPMEDGRLWGVVAPEPAARALVDAGADVVGFNCGASPLAVERACALAPSARWARPAAGRSSTALGAPTGSPDLARVLARLANAVPWVGGCCGVGPADLADGRRAWYVTGSLPPDHCA